MAGFAVSANGRFSDVHRGHPHEIEQSAVKTSLMNLPFKAEHGAHDAWVYVLEIDSCLHDVFRLLLMKTTDNPPS
jgi:hypothetical protein